MPEESGLPAVETREGVPSFEELYRQHAERVLRLAYRFTRSEAAARDITQEVFIKIYEHLDTFRGQSQLATWVHRIAMNQILNHLKSEKRRKWLDLLDEKIADAMEADLSLMSRWGATESARPDHQLERAEREQFVWSCVESLPVRYRVPFVLFRYEEMSYNEVAATLRISLSAVEARIHRAKKMLIAKLKPHIQYL